MASIRAVTTDDFKIEVFKRAIATNPWYVVLFSGTTAPTADMTAASFWATYTEITSYAAATRPAWTAADVVGSPMALGVEQPSDNLAAIASNVPVFDFSSLTDNVTVNGGALVSKSAKGDKTGSVAMIWLYSTPISAANQIIPVYAVMDVSDACAVPTRRI